MIAILISGRQEQSEQTITFRENDMEFERFIQLI